MHLGIWKNTREVPQVLKCALNLQSTPTRAFTSTLNAAMEKVVKVPLNATIQYYQ